METSCRCISRCGRVRCSQRRSVPARARPITIWVTFSNRATVLVAPTYDHEAVRAALPTRAEIEGSALGDGALRAVEVAARAGAFGMSVIHTGRDADAVPLDRLLATSDIVSLHVPLCPDTRHLIDQAALARMKRSAYLINTARGPVVDEAALVWALKSRLIAGAALDVTDPEPLPDSHPLWSMPNCIITPHAGNTDEMAIPLLSERISTNVRRFEAGDDLVGPVHVDLGY